MSEPVEEIMGLYPIDCPSCKKPFMWFSGNAGDQRCDECRAVVNAVEVLQDDDPTPWCANCGAKFSHQCKCPPRADND